MVCLFIVLYKMDSIQAKFKKKIQETKDSSLENKVNKQNQWRLNISNIFHEYTIFD